MEKRAIVARASPTVAPGPSVTGSRIMPNSERFTRRTSSACRSAVMLLCSIPMPPSRASAMASADSVTVSIAADTSGTLRRMRGVRSVDVSTSRGITSLCAGTSRTSS